MSTDLEGAIRAALNERFKVIVSEGIEKAKERVAQRLHEHATTTAMTVAKFYEVHRDRDCIVIRVKDGSEGRLA